MKTDRKIITIIEEAMTAAPYCECGQPNTAAERPEGLYLECSTLATPPVGFGARLSGLFDTHDRRLLLDCAELAA
jgi:hypothetical protein